MEKEEEAGGWSLAFRRGSVGKCRMDVSFSLWGNFVFDCCLYLSFRGLIPVSLDREMLRRVCMCVCE